MVKKSLLLLMVLLFAGFTSIKAQETIVFDFENDFAAGSLLGMTTIDADGDGYDWYVRPTGLSQLGHGDSNGFMTSASYQGGALTPDNYLVTPQGQYASINFFASAQDPSWPVEHFGVAVSTASGTSAADFTTIEEWDMSAKSLGNNMTVGRDGRQTKAGAWYEYTVDLSAYAGQDIYVAIRHFDCTDMFRLNVDDITLTVPDNNVVIDFETGDFSQYDFNNTSSYAWTVVEEDGNHYMKSGNAGVASSTSTISATHVFESDGYIAFDYNCMGEGSSTFWDHCDFAIDGTQIFTHGADHQGWDSFLQELAAGSHTFTWSYTKDSSVNPTGDYFAVDNIVFGEGSPCVAPSTLSVSGRTFIATWNGIADVYTFRYKAAAETTWTTISNITENTCTLPELAFGDYNAEVQADCDAGNWTATTFTVSDPSDYNVCVILEAHDVWGDGSGYQMLLDADASAYGDIIPETGGLTSSGNAPAGLYDNFEFLIPEDADGNLTTTHIVFDGEVAIYIPAGVYDWCIVNPTPGDRLWIASSNGDCPGRYDDFEFLANNTYRFTLGVYGTNDGVSLTVTQNGPVIQTAAVTGFTAPRFGEAPDFDLVAPTHTTITDVKWYKGTAEMAATDTFDDESASYHMSVVLEAEEGYEFDPQVTVTFNGDATICASATLTDGVLTANTINYNVVDSDVYDFEDGTFQGWTTIDADGDGVTWLQASEYMSGQAGHDNSLDFVFSQSYDNNTGVLYPDNYLVSPAKAHYTQISFFACAQDSGYPSEHFGVAVSTGSNTSAADFVMVQEWTMTSKKAAGEYRTREGSRDQGNWYEYTVDLSGFTGEYWVAIRHFNCSDMFYLDVDDISLAIGDAVVENYADVMTIYPNPAKDRVFVTSDVTVNEYRVYNVTGAEIMNNVVNNTTFEVNVDNLPAGVYYIRIYSEGLIQTKKFVKE